MLAGHTWTALFIFCIIYVGAWVPHLLLVVSGCWWAQVKNLDTGEVLAISESFDEGVLTAGVVGDAAAAAKAGYVRQQSLLEETLMKNIASALGPAPVTHVRAGSGRQTDCSLVWAPCCGRLLFPVPFCPLPQGPGCVACSGA